VQLHHVSFHCQCCNSIFTYTKNCITRRPCSRFFLLQLLQSAVYLYLIIWLKLKKKTFTAAAAAADAVLPLVYYFRGLFAQVDDDDFEDAHI
jgi:hypothetical protein